MKKQLVVDLLEALLESGGKTAEKTAEKTLPFVIGEAYLMRTVTHIEVGRVSAIHGQFVILEDASWIADTGRYHDCLVSGGFDEIEPYPLYTAVNAESLINYAPWPHELPRKQK